jgi:hypothetical protein
MPAQLTLGQRRALAPGQQMLSAQASTSAAAGGRWGTRTPSRAARAPGPQRSTAQRRQGRAAPRCCSQCSSVVGALAPCPAVRSAAQAIGCRVVEVSSAKPSAASHSSCLCRKLPRRAPRGTGARVPAQPGKAAGLGCGVVKQVQRAAPGGGGPGSGVAPRRRASGTRAQALVGRRWSAAARGTELGALARTSCEKLLMPQCRSNCAA